MSRFDNTSQLHSILNDLPVGQSLPEGMKTRHNFNQNYIEELKLKPRYPIEKNPHEFNLTFNVKDFHINGLDSD